MAKKTFPNWIWLILYKRGWEDPEWGQRPIDQVAIASAIHELAGELKGSAGKAVQAAATKAVAAAASSFR